jgi:hypothetical protein
MARKTYPVPCKILEDSITTAIRPTVRALDGFYAEIRTSGQVEIDGKIYAWDITTAEVYLPCVSDTSSVPLFPDAIGR